MPNIWRTKDFFEESVHVLVIGESLGRHHMSLYGYPRETTPNMKKLTEAVVFDNVISPHSHTVPSLLKILSFVENDPVIERGNNSQHSSSYVQLHLSLLQKAVQTGKLLNILDVMKKMGYETWWITNQLALGSWETSIMSLFLFSADHLFLVNKGEEFSFDEKVIPLFLRELKRKGSSKNRLFVIHLMGIHELYSKRYPKEYEVFKTKEDLQNEFQMKNGNIVNHYDNGVLYNDFVVSSLLNILKEFGPTLSTLTYFSDHGEEVYDFRDMFGHNEVIASTYMFDIPFVFWASPDYILVRQNLINNLKKKRHTPYVLDNFIPFLSKRCRSIFRFL